MERVIFCRTCKIYCAFEDRAELHGGHTWRLVPERELEGIKRENEAVLGLRCDREGINNKKGVIE